MGWKLEVVEVEKIKPNEEKDIFVTLEEEKRVVIHGVVKFPNGKPVKGAAVKLFKKVEHREDHREDRKEDYKEEHKECSDTFKLIPITFAFTDECGQFLFGVESEEEYVVKVFFYKPEKPTPPKDKTVA